MPAAMNKTQKSFWLWYWRERSGVVVFPGIRGVRRLVFDIPIFFLCTYALYLWFLRLPEPGRRFVLSIYRTPFAIAAILLILAHQIGVSYMRDRLTLQPTFPARLLFLFPGTVLRLYKEEFGNDSLVRTLRGIGFAALASFAIGLLIFNLVRAHVN